MNKNIIFIIIFQFVFTQGFSDFSYVGSKSISMAGSIVSNINDEETIFYNPAGLSKNKKLSVIAGTTNLYGLNFLKHQYLGILLPNNIAFSYQDLGTDFPNSDISLSQEQCLTVGGGYYLLNDANSTLSIGFNINALFFEQGKSAGTMGDGTDGLSGSKSKNLGIDLAMHASLRDRFSFGVSIKNINNPSIDKMSSRTFYPRRLDIGLTYHPFENLYTSFALQRIFGKDSNSFRFGIEYNLTSSFGLRTGIQMNPNRFGCGMIYVWEMFELSYSLLTHPVLPATSTLSFKVNFED